MVFCLGYEFRELDKETTAKCLTGSHASKEQCFRNKFLK